MEGEYTTAANNKHGLTPANAGAISCTAANTTTAKSAKTTLARSAFTADENVLQRSEVHAWRDTPFLFKAGLVRVQFISDEANSQGRREHAS